MTILKDAPGIISPYDGIIFYTSYGHKDIFSQRGGDKDDVLSEKWTDPLCRDHTHGFDRDTPDGRDYDHSYQCGSIKVNQYCYVVCDGITSCLWTFHLGKDTGGRSDLCQHVLATGRNELACFDSGYGTGQSDGYSRYIGLQVEAVQN